MDDYGRVAVLKSGLQVGRHLVCTAEYSAASYGLVFVFAMFLSCRVYPIEYARPRRIETGTQFVYCASPYQYWLRPRFDPRLI